MTSIMPIFQPRRASWKTGKPSLADGGQQGPGGPSEPMASPDGAASGLARVLVPALERFVCALWQE